MELKPYKTGLIVGKFMPLHKGHVYLINFALEVCQKVIVLVDCLKTQTLLPTVRRDVIIEEFMKEVLDNRLIVKAIDEFTPQEPSEHPHFWNYWKPLLSKTAGEPYDCLIASTDYAPRLAQELGVPLVECDTQRESINISATRIRNDLTTHWNYLPHASQNLFKKSIALLGPESTGKSTTAKMMAHYFSGIAIPEYAEKYIQLHGELTYNDMEKIAWGQKASEKAILKTDKQWFFCDSESITTKIWSQTLFKKYPSILDEFITNSQYILYILFTPEVIWKDGKHRNCLKNSSSIESRWDFFYAMENELKKFNKNYMILDGTSYLDRNNKIIRAIEQLEK